MAMPIPNGKVEKNYVFRGKQVYIIKIEANNESFYAFKIVNKADRREVYSGEFEDFESCERASWTVVRTNYVNAQGGFSR